MVRDLLRFGLLRQDRALFDELKIAEVRLLDRVRLDRDARAGFAAGEKTARDCHLRLGQLRGDERRSVGADRSICHLLALRVSLDNCTIAGRGRASSPAPEGR